jgi:hypothetical protein
MKSTKSSTVRYKVVFVLQWQQYSAVMDFMIFLFPNITCLIGYEEPEDGFIKAETR